MGNEEMGKLMHGKQTADVLLSAVIKGKSMSMYALTERSSLPDSWHQRGMQWHCSTVCKLILCVSSSLLPAY